MKAPLVASLCMIVLGNFAALGQEQTKLSVGEVAPIAAAWPSFVAEQKGFFKKQGLDVTLTYAGSAANSAQQLVGGAFDVSVTTFDTALRAVASGAKIRLLGTPVIKYPYSIMVQPTISSVKDLKGKTIILSFQKDMTTAIWNKWLNENGIAPKEIDQVYDGATPNRFAALVAKRVDAAFVGPPFDFRAERDGYRKLLDFGDYAVGFPFTAVIAREDWLAAHQAVAKQYVTALSEAIDWLYDDKNRTEAADILARATKQDQELSLLTYDYYMKRLQAFSRNLEVPAKAIELEATALVGLGDIKSVSAIPKEFFSSPGTTGK